MTTDSHPVYWLAILPWLHLSSEVRLGGVRFVSVDTAHPGQAIAELESISKDCAQVLRSWRLSHQCGINRCTLLIPNDWNPCVPPDNAAQAELGRMTNLLMLCAFAANRYGYHNSWNANASMFQLYTATFTSPPGYVGLTTRLRDGTSSTAGVRYGDPLFYVPAECNPPQPMSVDKRLAESIGSLEDSVPLAERLRFALPFFGWANTLAATSSWEMEIIALVAAFEKLLHQGSDSGVVNEIDRLLQGYETVPLRNARGTRPSITVKPAAQNDPVHKSWVRDLYRARHRSAHPRPNERPEWEPYEHLAMGAFLFPLLVKLLLAQDDLYGLTWPDKAACDAVNMLLAKTDWFVWGEVEDSAYSFDAPTVWAATLKEANCVRSTKEAEEISGRIDLSKGEATPE